MLSKKLEATLKEMYQAGSITEGQLKTAIADPAKGEAMAQAELRRRQNAAPSNLKSSNTQESEMIIKEFDLVEHLKKSLPDSLKGETKEKQAPVQAGSSFFQPHYPGVGVPPIHGGSAHVTKEAGQSVTIIDGFFDLNQAYGQPAATKPGNIIDALFQLNQRWGNGG